ncbi:ornithine cyclodeaminase [Rhizobium halophytocola]|uniref:Alanine dehydrogenase n=1 Tax=Rhizobium halophytocola TaxID=735519 RepID=A0ABS4E4D4_9HYPH|nr:ornithine cyclodeaminase [Rhizobium halophytocola]MBP1852815.1 alanine dehydrogenase [Rhizobium halophytocola]
MPRQQFDTDYALISAQQLTDLQAHLDLRELHQVMKEAWIAIRSGQSIGGKAVLSLDGVDSWGASDQIGLHPLDGERLGWKLSCLYSVNERHGGVKVVGANAVNRAHGVARSCSTYLLLDKFSLRPVAILEASQLSAARTGTYASEVLRRFRRSERRLSVFIFGAGPVAQATIQSLDHVMHDSLTAVFVRSRSLETAKLVSHDLSGKLGLPIEAVEDNAMLARCEMVVTATNAAAPVFAEGQLHPGALTLHLGGDEVPETYLRRMLREGRVVCDSLHLVSKRNSQSLALYFSRMGRSLEEIGPLIGVRELVSPEPPDLAPDEPVCVTCVGLPMLDLFAAEATFSKYRRQLDAKAGGKR